MNIIANWKWVLLLIMASLAEATASDLDSLRRAFLEPPADCRPHTRWWWMGNALRPEDIALQLSEMHKNGIGGVEQITMGAVYEKGNHPYLSREYFELLTYAVREAKRYGMEFSLNFGGPGWIWGGDWLPKNERNQNMIASSAEISGPRHYRGELPLTAVLNPRNPSEPLERIRPEDQVLALIAGRVEEGRLVESSLIDLSPQIRARRIEWHVPPGRWRLMAFWLVCNQIGGPAVDHFSKSAMQHYCDFLGNALRQAVGSEFGKTIESMFADSFEVPVFRNGLYWSSGLLEQFRKMKGYELTPFLPALWWEVGEISPKIRYDVNEFLNQVGLETFFKTFIGWCRQNGVKARIQPYGFTTDILQGAGMSDIPEMEITAGEKDAVPWFDTRIGPRTYTASGAQLYGRNIVSVEAYTYLHWEQARETLEELKISSDLFFRSGANKFYNHGYTGTPETDFVPSRRFGAEMLISRPNTWWPYYRHLSDYVARASVLLRQGRPVADVAVYSPLANQWTLDVLNARRWTRDFEWGELGKLLLANGYDFTLINDDVLQNHSRLDGGGIRVRDLEYRILILPNIGALPLETFQRVEQFAHNGGVVLALEQIPKTATGLADYPRRDAEIKKLSSELFGEPKGRDDDGRRRYAGGYTYFLRQVLYRSNPLDRRSSVLDPFLKTLRRHVAPDFGIDFVGEGIRENEGLIYTHRKTEGAEIYFVSNLQDRSVDSRVAFRVSGKAPQEWDPVSGRIRLLYEYEPQGSATILPVRLAPYESTFFVFSGNPIPLPVTHSNFFRILDLQEDGIRALAEHNGRHFLSRGSAGYSAQVEGLPAPYQIAGVWRLVLEGQDFPRIEKDITQLGSWTEDPATRHFSGTGRLSIDFPLPAVYVAEDLQLMLNLGDVGNVAEVTLNGIHLGVVWMRGQILDMTHTARQGQNSLMVQVTNTLINRVSGWKQTPPLPPELAALFGRGLHDDLGSARGIFGFEPLPKSGLMGPVVIKPFKIVKATHN